MNTHRIGRIGLAALLCLSSLGAAAAGWEYQANTDAMTSATVNIAAVGSENAVHLPFPYSGDTYAHLSVRKRPREGVTVAVVAGNGQIICHSDCGITVRFDSNPPMRFSGVGPTDGDSKVVFFNNEPKFLAAAKKAKKILVELTFYQAGSQIFEFNTPTPLVWPPQPATKK